MAKTKQVKARRAKAEPVESPPEDERLIRDGEEAAAEYTKSTSRARDQIIPMARGLLAARRCYSADQDFGDWLKQSPYRDIHHNDRAALINIGKHEAELTRVIQATDLTSPRLIWESCRAEVMSVYPEDKPAAEQAAINGHDTSDITEAKPDTGVARAIEKAAAQGQAAQETQTKESKTKKPLDPDDWTVDETQRWFAQSGRDALTMFKLYGTRAQAKLNTANLRAAIAAIDEPERIIEALRETAKALNSLAAKAEEVLPAATAEAA